MNGPALVAVCTGMQSFVKSDPEKNVDLPAPSMDAPWTIARLIGWTTEFLTRQGVDDPRLASEVLLAHATGLRRIDLYARFERIPDAAALSKFREWVRRAANHEPVAYLVGQREFFSLPFSVNSDVLIPRPESETLVECLLDRCKAKGWDAPVILDMATGSGCLVIAALANLPNARAVATDISETALAIAKANAERNRVADRLELLVADRLDLPRSVIPAGGFHSIVCNPPYIAQEGIGSLDRAVKDFEPAIALTDGGDGLSFYRTLASDAPGLLRADGILIVEVADGQSPKVVQIMTVDDRFRLEQSRKDAVVGKERALVFTLPVSR